MGIGRACGQQRTLTPQNRPPAGDIQQAHQRGGHVGQGRRTQQLASVTPVSFVQNTVLVQQRQGAVETGVKLRRQRCQVDQC